MCTTVVAVVVVTTAAKRISVRTKPPSLQLSQARALVSNTPLPLGSAPAHPGSRGGGGSREGVGVLTTRWPAAHLIERAAGTGEADDDGDNSEHEDGQADGYGCPKPAKEPAVTQGASCPSPALAVHTPPFPGAPFLPEETRPHRATSRWGNLNLLPTISPV